MHSRLLNDTSNSHLEEEEEEALGSCTRALYAVDEPHSSRSDVTSESVCLQVIATSTFCVHGKGSILERKGHGDGELCSDI